MAHFLGHVLHGSAVHHVPGMWRLPNDRVNLPASQFQYWQVMGQVMERGLFDAMFIDEKLATNTAYKGNSDATIKWGVRWPTHEAGALVPIVATATDHLGVAVTLLVDFEHPYSMARRLGSLDHLSKGRVAWNVARSHSGGESGAYGREASASTDPYEILDEYLDLCYRLWDSWEPDAIIKDVETGVYADPAKVHVVDHDGKYYKCHARGFVERSPQGYPVLGHAGSSERGRDFAAQHAETVFAIPPTINTMQEYSNDLNDCLESKFNRPAGSAKLIYGLQTVVDVTRERAQEKFEFIKSRMPLEAALTIMSDNTNVDFSQFDLDNYIQDIEVPGGQGTMDALSQFKDGAPLTLREAAEIYGLSMGAPVAVGTPKDIADQMEYYMDEGGADGFMLLATGTPQCFVDIADLVVPEMQRRGRYRKQYNGSMLRDNLLEW